MTARKAMTPRRRRQIAELRGWQTTSGEPLAIERNAKQVRQVVLLATGTKPQIDHIYQISLSHDDSDANLAPMAEEEHKPKTAKDAAVRAKLRRLTGKNKPKLKTNWPSRPIPKRADPWNKR